MRVRIGYLRRYLDLEGGDLKHYVNWSGNLYGDTNIDDWQFYNFDSKAAADEMYSLAKKNAEYYDLIDKGKVVRTPFVEVVG